MQLGGPDTVESILGQTGGFGADYTFEATGIAAVMRHAVESARMGWGLCTFHRWMAGDLDLQPFLSHELTLDEVNRGFELMEAQDGIRSVIRFG